MSHSANNPIRISIADDHKMFVSGLESIIEESPDMQVVDRCFSGSGVLDMLNRQPTDVLLLDINMPELNGIEVCKLVKKNHDKVKVLVLSMFNEESYINELLNNGAVGYVLKDTEVRELMHAIREVSKGETYFSKAVTQTIVNSVVNRMKGDAAPAAPAEGKVLPVLSRREKEILKLIVSEFSTQEIAEQLFISPKTVEVHRSNLLTKFGVRNTAGMVRVAMENKLVE
jgi:DNA-binding NarL/FixJ family response regulator